MADKEPTPAEPAAKPAKKSSKGKLFIIVGVVVVLLGGGGLAAYYTMRKPADPTAAAQAPKKDTHAGTGIISFEPFVVNLADTGGQRFLRISVRLIVGNEEEAKRIQESEVQVMRLRSGILELLTAQTSEHIVTQDGKAALKKEIAELAGHIVAPIEVSDVLFSDFVVQYYDVPVNPYAGMLDVTCRVEVIVGSGSITVRDCLKLERDSIIRLEQLAGSDLQITVQGVPAATGEIVIDEDSTSVRIAGVLPPPSAEGPQ